MKYDAPLQDMQFLLAEFIGMEQIRSLPGHEDFDEDLAAAILEEAGLRLGEDYPHPIVDHAAARRRALEGYEKIKKSS